MPENIRVKNAIEVRDITKTYFDGVEFQALNGISFTIKEGEFVAITGPSGSGKSTLLNILTALDLPTTGKVLIDGEEIDKMTNIQLAKLRNEKIGFIFQSFNLINTMTALENVELPLLIRDISKADRQKRAIELLDSFMLKSKINVTPTKLSGGQQQRVAIARALVTDPKILIGDEPTGDLNTDDTEVIMKSLRSLNAKTGKTLVIVTHDPEVAAQAERIIQLRDGKVINIKINTSYKKLKS